ncbi:uncharacterized protein SPAPADRAFT_60413 [Spathaspora passalidarum NRRL Y-27907]|uniref:Uncharacterized protein n=1 Tax=Spathaspora passalidarum (strain NRRL Y-27907 / 11-Y1) TaxID=619300 RepID=G3AL64_SPAPN|nr:uncharacterized protein SPAPADRAFT_60413 [Spathaspora passalidarum NRRL Y-27907]EGW33107.1 hypothetical protein SPAPADRAFT_60413 [Spathaspora passalidarum NRRL Y-27907]
MNIRYFISGRNISQIGNPRIIVSSIAILLTIFVLIETTATIRRDSVLGSNIFQLLSSLLKHVSL